MLDRSQMHVSVGLFFNDPTESRDTSSSNIFILNQRKNKKKHIHINWGLIV